MATSEQEIRNKLTEVKNDFYGYCFALFIMFGGFLSKDFIQWEWLSDVINFCLVVVLYELVCLSYKYFKLKRQLCD